MGRAKNTGASNRHPAIPTGTLFHGWKHFIPEVSFAAVILVLVDIQLLSADRFADLAISPFWIPVVVASVHYGCGGGLFAAIAASAALYSGGLPEHKADTDFYEYGALLVQQPAEWVACALTLGALRSIHLKKTVRLEAALQDCRRRAADLGDGLMTAVDEIAALECRIASDRATVDAALEGMAGLALANRTDMLVAAGKLLASLAPVSAYTVHVAVGDGFQPVHAAGDDDSPRLLHPLRLEQFAHDGLRDRPRTLSILDEGGRRSLPAHVLAAIPVCSSFSHIRYGLLVIEGVDSEPDTWADALATAIRRGEAIAQTVGPLADTVADPLPFIDASSDARHANAAE